MAETERIGINDILSRFLKGLELQCIRMSQRCRDNCPLTEDWELFIVATLTDNLSKLREEEPKFIQLAYVHKVEDIGLNFQVRLDLTFRYMGESGYGKHSSLFIIPKS